MSNIVRRALRSPVFWILLFGTLLRLALAPITEDPWDLRVWKLVGKVIDARLSPYTIKSDLPFAYPPLWSIFCWLGYQAFKLAGSEWVFNLALKLPLILADLACALLLWQLVQRVTTSRRTALTVMAAYFLNPVVIAVSSAWGMFDALPALLVLVSILLLADGRDIWSALVLGTSAGFKGFYTAFYLPFFLYYLWKKERNLTAALRYALCFCLVPLAISLPFLLTDADSYLGVFATHATRRPQNLNVGYWLWRVINPDLRDRLGLPTTYAFAVLFPLLYLAVLIRARRWTVDKWSDSLAFLVKGAALLCLAYYATSKVVNEQFLVWGLALLALYAWLYDPRAKPFFYALCLIDLAFISLNAGPHFFHLFRRPPAWWYGSPLFPKILGWLGLIFWLTVVACFVTLMKGGEKGRRAVPIAKRAGLALLTLFVVITLIFILSDNVLRFTYARLWAKAMARDMGIDYEEAFRQVRKEMGLTYQSAFQRYVQFLSGLPKGNLGESWHGPVSLLVAGSLPWTVLVLSVSLFLSFVIGGLLGAVAAWKRDTIVYPVVTLYAAISAAIPNYLTALLLLVVLAINLRLFPIRGAYDSSLTPGLNWPFIKSMLHHAALPIAAYTFTMAGTWTLVMKGSAVSVLGEDYVMAARARGLKERRIISAYVGRNAALPLVTRLAVVIANILGSAPFIDTILSYPGLGFLFDEALNESDFVLMQGIFFVIAAAVVVANLGTDLLYSALDPRVKLEG